MECCGIHKSSHKFLTPPLPQLRSSGLPHLNNVYSIQFPLGYLFFTVEPRYIKLAYSEEMGTVKANHSSNFAFICTFSPPYSEHGYNEEADKKIKDQLLK